MLSMPCVLGVATLEKAHGTNIVPWLPLFLETEPRLHYTSNLLLLPCVASVRVSVCSVTLEHFACGVRI